MPSVFTLEGSTRIPRMPAFLSGDLAQPIAGGLGSDVWKYLLGGIAVVGLGYFASKKLRGGLSGLRGLNGVPVEGTPELARKLHLFHNGMDSIYAVGSQWIDGRPADSDTVREAADQLEVDSYRAKRKGSKLRGAATLAKTIRTLANKAEKSKKPPDAPWVPAWQPSME